MTSNRIIVVCSNRIIGEALDAALQQFKLAAQSLMRSLYDLSTSIEVQANDVIIWCPALTQHTADLDVELAALRSLTCSAPLLHVIVLSFQAVASPIEAILRDAGAAALLPPDITFSTIVSAIELIGLGQQIFPSQEAAGGAALYKVADARVLQPTPLLPASAASLSPITSVAGSDIPAGSVIGGAAPGGQLRRTVSLSVREQEVLKMLAKGLSNKQIARDLRIAESTVKVHLKGLLRKVGASNRTQAAIWGLAHTPKQGR